MLNYESPVGFIVEGHGEYNCYPSLYCRIVNAKGYKIPRLNAGGCGSVIKHLKEQLTTLLLIESPQTVIITVDLQDAIRQKLATTCEELIQILNKKIDQWTEAAQQNERLQPLPNNIIVIIQIRKFESWLISDIVGLIQAGLIDNNVEQIADTEAYTKPDQWLKEKLLINGCIKNPKVAKTIVSAINPGTMRVHNQSFDKFFRESKIAYNAWIDKNVDN